RPATSYAADRSAYVWLARFSEGKATAITVDTTRAATQDSVSDMSVPPEWRPQRVYSSYALPGHYGNKNIFQRRRDLSDAVDAEFQFFANRKDLFLCIVGIPDGEMQLV